MASRGPSIHRVHKMLRRPAKENPHLKVLQTRVSKASEEPGIYRWLDKDGHVLYVGKAKNLRKRLKWYVSPRPGAFVGPWRESFLQQIADFDVTVTNSELEALILETNLIKELKPKYNVLMKDDKNYLYVRVTVHEPFPRVEAARRIIEDGSKYFEPTTSSEEVRKTLALLRKIYPYRTCSMNIELDRPLLKVEDERKSPEEAVSNQPSAISNEKKSDSWKLEADGSSGSRKIPIDVLCTNKDRPTPCLDYHMKQCSAPCVGERTPEEYFRESIEGVLEFLKGNHEPVKSLLTLRMQQAAKERNFEAAARHRDMLETLNTMEEKQLVSDTSGENSDIIGIALLSKRAHVVVLQRRNGRLIGESNFALSGEAETVSEVLEQFLPQYYNDGIDIPDAIVAGEEIPDRKVFAQWLSIKKGKTVKLIVPERGKKSHLLMLAEKNAREKAKLHEIKWESEIRNRESALATLQDLLQLPAPPHRIEGYDISHLGGTETVGSMTVLLDGKSANDQYRSFTIRSMQRGMVDDYRALQEVLQRRLRHLTRSVEVEEEKWQAAGVEFGKARKAEQPEIERIHREHAEEMSGSDIDYREYVLARHGSEIIAFGRLRHLNGKLLELKSIWVADEYRGQRLGQLIARRILRTVKKGKVYVTCDPSLESYYGEIGFRYVLKAPPLLQEKIEAAIKAHPDQESVRTVVLMFDAAQNKADPSLTSHPDLLVIDGGKGQLSAVVAVLQKMNLQIPVIGLAKREEEVFLPGQSDPVTFPGESPAKFLLMRLRDEAHRFANRHREMRGHKKAKGSILDEIPGIGAQTKKELLQKFGTVSEIRKASDEALLEIVNEEQLQGLRRIV